MNLRPLEKMAILQVKAYIDEHYMNQFTISELSNHSWQVVSKSIQHDIFFNAMRLHKVFQLTFLQTIHSYQTAIRMEKAKELLLHTDLSIKAIAISVGYTGGNNFTPVFKKSFGVTPSKYRNQS